MSETPGTPAPALLPVAEAQARLLAAVRPVATQTVPLAQAHGRYAVTDVIALRTQPATDLSAMDGYAIRFADLAGPWRSVGESAAGRPLDHVLAAGEAARIFTGAAMPAGADTVLVQEEAIAEDGIVRLTGEGPPRLGANVRRRGLDFSAGDRIIVRGEALTAARLAVAAIAGLTELMVARPIRVAIAATGDELASLGTLDALPESNRLMIAAQLTGLPIELIDLGIVPDRLDALRDAFAGARDADLIVTSGGASVGDHDLVQPALVAVGGRIDFWRVALRPGKPLLAGRLGDAMVLGLPGNPVSAFVTAELFVKPLIRALAGAAEQLPLVGTARLAEALPANDHRTDYLRARTGPDGVSIATIQDSSMLLTLARADCLVVRLPHAVPAAVGETVDILALA